MSEPVDDKVIRTSMNCRSKRPSLYLTVNHKMEKCPIESSTHLLWSIVALITCCQPCIAREWLDETGRHSINAKYAGIMVVLQLEDGATKQVPFVQLSKKDQQHLLEKLQAERSLKPQEVKADKDLKEEVRPKFDAALLDELEMLFKHLVSSASCDKECRNRLGEILSILVDNKKEAEGITGYLLQIEQIMSSRFRSFMGRSAAVDRLGNSSRIYGSNLIIYRKLVNTLSENVTINEEAKKHFESIISELRTSPSSDVRLKAALRLYGAEGMSNIALPELVSSLEKDPASPVRLAAATSIGGYALSKDKLLPLLVVAFKKSSEREKHVLAWAICDLDPKSSITTKFINECFDAVEKQRNYSSGWLLDFLLEHKEQTAKFIGRLLAYAKRVEKTWAENIGRGYASSDKNETLQAISDILINLGTDDPRILKFYRDKGAKRPETIEVYCDSVVRRLDVQ